MAKIKLSGINDLLTISEQEAKNIRQLQADDYKGTTTAGNMTFQVRDVRFIKLDDDLSTPENNYYSQYVAAREKRLMLTPEIRAKQSMGQFSFVYWMLTGDPATEELRGKAEKTAAEFFKQNPAWSFPSMSCWFKFLGVEKKADLKLKFPHAQQDPFRILENSERSEVSMAGNPR